LDKELADKTLENLTQNLMTSALDKTDGELLLACRRGDETAWQALVDRFERLICSVPRRAGLNEELVADIFQETFLTLFEKLDEIEQPERLRAWLVTTAKFKTWRAVKQSRQFGDTYQKDGEDLPDEMMSLPDNSPLPDEILIELEEQHLIRTALDKLDERCQIMLTMLYLREPNATYVEVAKAVGVSETSISPLRARCLKKMMKFLKK
jgi:RNA polymerase sigma factor (sigma-70 family)